MPQAVWIFWQPRRMGRMADDDLQTPDQNTRQAADNSHDRETDSPGPPVSKRRRSSYATRDLTKGSVPKNLWFLGWPQVAEGFLSVVDQLADLIWAGRLGFQAIAGLGVAQTYLMLVMTARMGLDTGMRTMIARAVGMRNIPYANHVFMQSLTLSSMFAAVSVLVGLFLTEPMLRILGLSDAVVSQASGYMRVQFIVMAVMGYQRLSASALQSSGDSLTPLKAATVTRVTHLVLSPLLIFGVWFFPSMGLTGAAAANLFAVTLGAIMNFYALIRGTSRLSLDLRNYSIDLPLIWRLIKIGAPASVTNMQRGFGQLIVVGIVASFGDGALAAFALTRRTENVVNQSSRSLGRAAGALAGQNLGANLPERAKSSINWALTYITAGTLVIVIGFLVFPDAVASFFNSDTEFVAQASTWITIVAVGYLSMSAVQVFTQALNSTGDTMAPMVITLSTMWAVEIPLAFALSLLTPLGQFGVPWAIVAGMTLRLLAFIWYYSKGRWLRTGML